MATAIGSLPLDELKIEHAEVLPDGSGFATASFPLPPDHWSNQPTLGLEPPMPFRIGTSPRRDELARQITEAGKYAYLMTGIGKEDHDPDAFLQNLVIALLGYWTEDGRSNVDSHP